MQNYVFISYSSKDDASVRKMVQLLMDMHVEYWKAPEKIPAGSNYAREINQAIEGCSLFLLLFSANSRESIWVEKELGCALSNRKEVIPYNIDGCELNDAFKFYLSNVQMIMHTPDSQDSINELKSILAPFSDASKGTGQAEKLSPKAPLPHVIPGLKEAAPQPVEKPKGPQKVVRNELLSLNRMPVYCSGCGGGLMKVSEGVYRCINCGKENYDDFREIDNYIRKSGGCSPLELERALGIPRKIIKEWRSHRE